MNVFKFHKLLVFSVVVPLVLLFTTCHTQDLGGVWRGKVWQKDSQDTFFYEINLQHNGEALAGQALSRSSDGSISATFNLSGRVSDKQITLQEVEQLTPESAKWCLKYLSLQLSANNQLSGEWTATGCRPGIVLLQRAGGTYTEEVPFTYPGRWSGHLSQSDRDYGFYYELNLKPDGTGTSKIVSEDAGGEAIHQLQWQETATGISFSEPEVLERTDPKWKWCLKSGQLIQSRTDGRYELEGDWGGYLEHKTPNNGACAPGMVYLNKPVLSKTVTEHIQPETEQYTERTQRTVKVDRVLKVRSDNIRIKVWDNGIVDGDILTLFLNGQQILHKYRVNKRRWSIPVDIIRGENLLILHAEDLGDISPNTVAVAIDDGVSEQVIVLSSNLRESGAILIQPFDF
ncbi:MAG: hypothetical protein AAFN81_26585 [Bacteroidota bacterium]